MRRRDPNRSGTFSCSVWGSYYLPSAYEIDVIAMSLYSNEVPDKYFIYYTK